MKLFPRENYLKKIRGFYHAADLIKVITGVRRCGKSSLMQTIAEELKAGGIAPENIHFIDLESLNNRYITQAEQLYEVIEKIQRGPGLNYLFIDEIQNVKDFEIIVNGLRKTEDWSIFITGSNSYLLSGELVTRLTGRYLEFELFPLSFEEYEQMKRFYNKEISDAKIVELTNYIQEGGFPRALFFDTLAEKKEYTKQVAREIFEKDIYKRINIRNKDKFEAFQAFLINNFASPMSLKSIHKAFEKAGNPISEATVARYVQALLDAKIIYECKRFDLKSKKSLRGEKKYYLSDLSFFFAQNTDNRIDYGPALENLTYIYARSHDYSVSVGKIGSFECDFILRDNKQQYSFVQVSLTLLFSKETEEREYRALERIKDTSPKYILTTDEIFRDRGQIQHVNLIDFMLKGRQF